MCCTKCEFENPAGSTLRTIHMRGLGRSFWTANRIERTLHPHVEGLCGSEHRRFMSMGVWERASNRKDRNVLIPVAPAMTGVFY